MSCLVRLLRWREVFVSDNQLERVLAALLVIVGWLHARAPKETSKATGPPSRRRDERRRRGCRSRSRQVQEPESLAIAVPVTFASADGSRTRTVELELDTGSAGITLFASAGRRPRARNGIGGPKTKTYGGGDVFEGQLAKAR